VRHRRSVLYSSEPPCRIRSTSRPVSPQAACRPIRKSIIGLPSVLLAGSSILIFQTE
jgi:hypothetical protein